MTESFLFKTKDTLRRRLSGHSLPSKCRDDLNSNIEELTSLMRRTIDYGESNSILIVGMKGSGKTTIYRKSLIKLTSSSKYFLIVNLNGYLQTDDKIALEEITRQLQLENTVGDRVFGSFAENLAFLLKALRGGKTCESTPIVFILEEFDLFAQHRNQTLLYNLFDIVQAGLTPMIVVGTTCRVDVMELLEKRVKSRFSHRQIFVSNKWTFDDYVQGFVELLTLPLNSNKKDKFFNDTKKWNSSIETLSKNATVLDILKRQFHLNKEIPCLQRLLALPVAMLTSDHPYITVTQLSDSAHITFSDSKLNMLRGVSILELCLLIAMNHLSNVYEGETFNFQMVYNEFLKFSKKKSHVLHNYSKLVVLKAFEHLVEMELLQPKDTNSIYAVKNSKDHRPMVLLISHNQLKEAVDKYNGCPTDVKQWAESSVV